MTDKIPKFVYYCHLDRSRWPVPVKVTELFDDGKLCLRFTRMERAFIDIEILDKRIIFTRWTRALDWMGAEYKKRAKAMTDLASAMDEELFRLASDLKRLPY